MSFFTQRAVCIVSLEDNAKVRCGLVITRKTEFRNGLNCGSTQTWKVASPPPPTLQLGAASGSWFQSNGMVRFMDGKGRRVFTFFFGSEEFFTRLNTIACGGQDVGCEASDTKFRSLWATISTNVCLT
jgi:hypothetical protein